MRYIDLPHDNAALAIFPCTVGFGWMLFDGPISPVDWDVCYAAKSKNMGMVKNERCLEAIETLIRERRPPIIVLEAFAGPGTRRAPRIRDLCRSIIALAAMNGVSVRILTRAQIRACLASAEDGSRHAIAKVASSFLDEIQVRLPEKRKSWETEDPDMALMNAAALLVVHYANPREPL